MFCRFKTLPVTRLSRNKEGKKRRGILDYFQKSLYYTKRGSLALVFRKNSILRVQEDGEI